MRIFRRATSMFAVSLLSLACTMALYADPISADLSAVKPGPIKVTASNESLTLRWSDASKHQWIAVFALNNKLPLISSISVDGAPVVQKAVPFYRCSTGARTGGWD